MAEDPRGAGGPSRPYSTPGGSTPRWALPRLNSTEPYRHRSLPPPDSPNSRRSSSEITFAVLYDDGPDYTIGHIDEAGSIRSGRAQSMMSNAPSYRSHNSVDYSQANWPLNDATNHLSANRAAMGLSGLQDRGTSMSQETLALSDLRTTRDSKDPSMRSSRSQTIRTEQSRHSAAPTYCTCHEDHDDVSTMKKDDYMPLRDVDMEAQKPTDGPFGPPGPGGPGEPDGPRDRNLVTFDGPKDPYNPKNWPSKHRWAATFVMASFTFVSPLASSMVAPALPNIAREFNITSDIESQMTLSIFVLAFAIGPLILGPLSETYGRVIVLQLSNVIFLAFNVGCGFAQSKQQLMAFRFLSGIGGSAPLAIGGGVLGDLFKPDERGKAMGLYAMGPLLGPAIGPIAGGWVAEKTTWRWMFWATSIVDLFILISGIFFLRESYAPYLLYKKAKKLRQETGNPFLKTEFEAQDPGVIKKLASNMMRSIRMLFTQPIVQVLAVYMAYSYGIMYLVLSTFPGLWMNTYHESVGIAGLNYISIGLGFFLGAPLCGKTNDTIYRKLKAKDPRGEGKPEFRMPLMIPFSFLVPIGLFIYGWSAQNATHWIVPNVGAFIFGMGTIAAFQCVTTYIVDSYARFAASAVAAVTVLRSLAGFTFPLFAPYMYKTLGYGWGNSVLGLAAVCIGFPAPVLLWLFGEKLRKRSSLAAKKGTK